MVDRKSGMSERWLDVYARFSLAGSYRGGTAASFLLITCLQNDSPLRIYISQRNAIEMELAPARRVIILM